MPADRAARRPLRERVEAWCKLAEAATPGPWKPGTPSGTTVEGIVGANNWCVFADSGRAMHDLLDEDSAFIIESREAVPALAAALLVAVEALERIGGSSQDSIYLAHIAADALRRMEEC